MNSEEQGAASLERTALISFLLKGQPVYARGGKRGLGAFRRGQGCCSRIKARGLAQLLCSARSFLRDGSYLGANFGVECSSQKRIITLGLGPKQRKILSFSYLISGVCSKKYLISGKIQKTRNTSRKGEVIIIKIIHTHCSEPLIIDIQRFFKEKELLEPNIPMNWVS